MKIANEIFTMVCDDVRHEIGGKFSLMGVYQGEMKLRGFPSLKGKLCFVVFFRDIKNVFKKCVITARIPGADPIEIKSDPPPDLPEKKFLQIFIELSPVNFSTEGDLIFGIYFDDEKKPTVTHRLKISSLSNKQ